MENKLKKYLSSFNGSDFFETQRKENFLLLIRIIRRDLKRDGFKTHKTKWFGHKALIINEPFKIVVIFDEQNQYFRLVQFHNTGLTVLFKANTYREFIDKCIRFNIMSPVLLHKHLSEK